LKIINLVGNDLKIILRWFGEKSVDDWTHETFGIPRRQTWTSTGLSHAVTQQQQPVRQYGMFLCRLFFLKEEVRGW